MSNDSEMPVVMFTNYKRPDGFEVSLTLRGTELGDVASDLDTAIKGIIKGGGTPAIRGRGGFPPREVEYIEGAKCPEDGARLIKAKKKDGKEYAKCENNKWDKINNRATGCPHVDWNYFDKKEGESLEDIAEHLA